MSQTVLEDQILAEYIEYKAAQAKRDPHEVAKEINREDFYENIYALHERFMAGEFSLGYMAQMLGITKPDLYHLLDAMGLKVTNL